MQGRKGEADSDLLVHGGEEKLGKAAAAPGVEAQGDGPGGGDGAQI